MSLEALRVADSNELPCWCWELDLGPFQEQCVSSATDSSLQPGTTHL